MKIDKKILNNIALSPTLICLFLFLSLSCNPKKQIDNNVLVIQENEDAPPIIIAENASKRIRNIAQTLSVYLEKITQVKFDLQIGDGFRGLVVGMPEHFSNISIPDQIRNPTGAMKEAYLIRTHDKGMYIIGASELAVEHAVWDLLYRVGYRQYFPGKVWEIVPSVPTLSLSLNIVEVPDYLTRSIRYGYGTWQNSKQAYNQWSARNRTTSSMVLNTGHAYARIIKKNQSEFDLHPEYYALVKGKRDIREHAKLCISNPSLQKLVQNHALNYFNDHPNANSISMDPSDGGGWCECEFCAKIGTISDQALFLANGVAESINTRYPQKLVGMYAYAYHSPPPSIRVHPQVVVSVATAFLRGGLSLDEIIDGWSRQGATLGIREYYSVFPWDHDMPSKSRGSNIIYLQKKIPEFYQKKARFMSAESGDSWAANGLGHYLAARMLWDVNESQRTGALVDDFLTNSFGSAKEPMEEFFHQIHVTQKPVIVKEQLGHMFAALDEAQKLADTPEVLARIHDLVLYARYADLFYGYSSLSGVKRQAAFENLVRHAYRIRSTMMVHSMGLYRDLPKRDKTISIPAGADWNIPEENNPWKSSREFTAEEISKFIDEGLQKYPLYSLRFNPVLFSDDLVSAAPLKLRTVDSGDLAAGRGEQIFYTYFSETPTTLELYITGGLIKHYRDRGNVRLALWEIGRNTNNSKQALITQNNSVSPDGIQHTVRFEIKSPGLYKILVRDGIDRTRVSWPEGTPMTVCSSFDQSMNVHYRQWTQYFYVPKGTKALWILGGNHGEIRDSKGRLLFSLNGKEVNYYSIQIPDEEDGKLWQVQYGKGAVRLLNTPPYFARNGRELLLPREVVEKDAFWPGKNIIN